MNFDVILLALGVSAKYGAMIVAVAAILAAILPQPAAGAWWVPLRKLVDLLGQNFGHADNILPEKPLVTAPASSAGAAA